MAYACNACLRHKTQEKQGNDHHKRQNRDYHIRKGGLHLVRETQRVCGMLAIVYFLSWVVVT